MILSIRRMCGAHGATSDDGIERAPAARRLVHTALSDLHADLLAPRRVCLHAAHSH